LRLDKDWQAVKSKIILCLALVLSGNCIAAIVYPKAPEGGRQLVFENVGQMLREHPDGTAISIRGLQIEDVTIAEPHRWYSVGATNLASGNLLSVAGSICWRYLLIHGRNAAGVATVFDANAKTGDALRFGALYQTGFSDDTLEALRKAKSLTQVKTQDYELRFLQVPAINFVAVWLHGKSDDIIMPLPPTFGRKLNAYQPYPESQIIKVLEPDAKEVMKAPRSFR
jgi:hypothetical protein